MVLKLFFLIHFILNVLNKKGNINLQIKLAKKNFKEKVYLYDELKDIEIKLKNSTKIVNFHYDFSRSDIILKNIECDLNISCDINSKIKTTKYLFYTELRTLKYREGIIKLIINENYNLEMKVKIIIKENWDLLGSNILGISPKSIIYKNFLEKNDNKKIYYDFFYYKPFNFISKTLKEKKDKEFKTSSLRIKEFKNLNNYFYVKIDENLDYFAIKNSSYEIQKDGKILKKDKNSVICIDNNLNTLFWLKDYDFLKKEVKNCNHKDCFNLKNIKHNKISVKFDFNGKKARSKGIGSILFTVNHLVNFDKNHELHINFIKYKEEINNKYKECSFIWGNKMFSLYPFNIKTRIQDGKYEFFVGFENIIFNIDSFYKIINYIIVFFGLFSFILLLIFLSKFFQKKKINKNEHLVEKEN